MFSPRLLREKYLTRHVIFRACKARRARECFRIEPPVRRHTPARALADLIFRKAKKGAYMIPHLKTVLVIAVVALVVIWATNRNVFGVGSLVGSV